MLDKNRGVPRIAIIGCGRIARSHCDAASRCGTSCELSAFVDKDAGRAEDFSKKYGGHVYTSIEQAAESGSFDCAIICLPHNMLARASGICLENGINVLVEKPCAESPGEFRALQQAAGKNNLILQPAYVRRFMPSYAGLRHMAQSGQTGRMTCYMSVTLTFLEKIAAPWWKSGNAALGFHVPVFASHQIDTVLWLKGELPGTVYAAYEYSGHLGIEGETEGIICLRFKDNSIGSIMFSRSSRGDDVKSERVIFENCAVDVAGKSLSRDMEPVELPSANPFAEQLKHFLKAAGGNSMEVVAPGDAVKVLQVMEACSLSDREKRAVEVSEAQC